MAGRCVDGGFGLDGCPPSRLAVMRDPAVWFEAMQRDNDIQGWAALVAVDAITPMLKPAPKAPAKALPEAMPNVFATSTQEAVNVR